MTTWQKGTFDLTSIPDPNWRHPAESMGGDADAGPADAMGAALMLVARVVAYIEGRPCAKGVCIGGRGIAGKGGALSGWGANASGGGAINSGGHGGGMAGQHPWVPPVTGAAMLPVRLWVVSYHLARPTCQPRTLEAFARSRGVTKQSVAKHCESFRAAFPEINWGDQRAGNGGDRTK
jgi:hypothetical protein